MTKRETNVEIDLTGEGPAIRKEGEEVVNPDGSVTKYATDPEPQGEERIVIAEENISDRQKRVLDIIKEHPEWTDASVAEEADVSKNLVSRVKNGSVGRPLGTFDQIKRAYQNLGDSHKRTVWVLSQFSEHPVEEIAEAMDISPTTITNYENYNEALINKLQAWDAIEVSPPGGVDVESLQDILGEEDVGRELEESEIPDEGIYIKESVLREWDVYEWGEKYGFDPSDGEEIVSTMMQAIQNTDGSETIHRPKSGDWKAIKLFIEALIESPHTEGQMASQILEQMERLEEEDE